MEPASTGMVRRRHHGTSGRRDYLLHLPAGPVRGLLVMLHGCLQTPEDFAAGTGMNAAAAANGYAVAWPEQSRGDNQNACWNWFRPAHQKRGFGEPAILAGIAEDLIRELAIPRRAVGVAGFSAGAAMALVLRDAYPDVFNAVAAHSGVAPGLAANAFAGLSLMKSGALDRSPAPARRPTLVIQGTADDIVHPSNATCILRAGGRSQLRIHSGLGHAWAGGDPDGSFTDPDFPSATADVIGFLFRQSAVTGRRWTGAAPLASRVQARPPVSDNRIGSMPSAANAASHLPR